ncbi:THUMP domain-containing protein 3 [Chionoecetes opilio]|uniref:THUMP domain-containing protein 3 n=1 Tax=Chionoecetes opilio TaxID=41210 RepID=A0A8J4Y050_CHIOP|nr:THUMP domain-containing protein 3 [Chionoecetes opilio]
MIAAVQFPSPSILGKLTLPIGAGMQHGDFKTLARTQSRDLVIIYRTGSTHKFGSPEAARQFGAGVNEIFSWPVDLSDYDLEVLLCIDTDFCSIFHLLCAIHFVSQPPHRLQHIKHQTCQGRVQ